MRPCNFFVNSALEQHLSFQEKARSDQRVSWGFRRWNHPLCFNLSTSRSGQVRPAEPRSLLRFQREGFGHGGFQSGNFVTGKVGVFRELALTFGERALVLETETDKQVWRGRWASPPPSRISFRAVS